MVLLFLLCAGVWFAWQYVMKTRERRIAGKWGGRMAVAVSVAGVSVVALFAVFSLNSWRLF